MASEIKSIDLIAKILALPAETLILVSERSPCHAEFLHYAPRAQ
jgi:hypothetical protein